MLLVVCKFHIFVILVTILRKTYGYEIRQPTPEQILKTMPHVKNNSHFAVGEKSLRFGGGLPGTWREKQEQKTLDDGEKSVRAGGGLPGTWKERPEPKTLDDGDSRRIKEEHKTLANGDTRRIKQEPKTLDDFDTRRIKQEPKTLDDFDTRRITQEEKALEDYDTRRIKQQQKTLDDYDTRRIKPEPELDDYNTRRMKQEPKTLDDHDTRKIKQEEKTLDDYDTRRTKQEPKTLNDYDTRRIKPEPKTLDDYDTRRIKPEPELDDYNTRRMKQEPKTLDDYDTRRIKPEPKTLDDYNTRTVKREQRTLDDDDTIRIKQKQRTLDDDDTIRIKQKHKTLDDGEQSFRSEVPVEPGLSEPKDVVARRTNYETQTVFANTEKSLIERTKNEPEISRKVDSHNSSTKKDLAVNLKNLNNSSELTISGKLHNVDGRELETTEKKVSPTERPISETQNGSDSATEPSDPTTTLSGTVEPLDVTKRPYALDFNIPTKAPVIPVPKVGDLILTRSQAQEISKNNFNLAKYRWPDRIVPIELSHSFNTREKLTILYALDMLEHNTCIKFSTRRRSDINYVQVSKRKDKPISSNLGCISGPQVVNLHAADTYDILHEFIHTLGIPHQHSVSKRDEYIKIISENIRPKLRAEFAKLGELEGYEYLNDYDRQSIMHFDEYAGSKNGNATIVAISGEIEPSPVPTDKDYVKINQLYQCD